MTAPTLKSWSSLGDYLRRARLERGLTQRDLATRLGWASPQRVSNVERSIELLSSKMAVTYCAALELEETGEIQTLLLKSVKEKLNQLFAAEPDRHPKP